MKGVPCIYINGAVWFKTTVRGGFVVHAVQGYTGVVPGHWSKRYER